MPQVSKDVTTQEKVDVAIGCDGKNIEVGDYVNLKLLVTRIRIVIDETSPNGEEKGQLLELSEVKENGYKLHTIVCDSKLCKKCE